MTSIDWIPLVPETATDPGWSHSGIAVTDDGVVIFAEPSGGGLILCRPDGSGTGFTVHRCDVPLLEIHGIVFLRDRGRDVLWLADPGFKARPELGYETESSPGQAGSLTLDDVDFTPLPPPDGSASRWQPTSTVAIRSEQNGPLRAIVADGYGESLVHFYSDGLLVRTIDGSESGTPFSCPHGLVIDERSGHPELVVADRGNRRLVFLSLDGAFLRSIADPTFTSPSSLAIRGDDLLVTELDGALVAVSGAGMVRPLVDTKDDRDREGWPNSSGADGSVRPRLDLGRLNSPHGLAVDGDGRIYLTEWVIGGRQLQLTLRDEQPAD